jgi:hypothetical protein
MKTPPIVWVVAIAFLGFVVAILVPIFASAKAAARMTSCRSSMKDMARGVGLYQADYDDRLMNAHTWGDQLMPYTPGELVCPCMKSRGVNFSYAMEPSVLEKLGSELLNPEKQGVIFDSKVMVRNASGGMSLLPDPPRHLRVNYVAYADGHIGAIRRQNLPDGAEGEWIGRW